MPSGRVLPALCVIGLLVGCGSTSPGSCPPPPSSAPVLAPADPPPATCGDNGLMSALGKNRLLIGYAGDDSVASQAPFDIRYQYLAGPIGSPTQACASYDWWGCWQDWSRPAGQFVVDFIAEAKKNGEIPMFTYYIILPASGVAEGAPEVDQAANDPTFMARYLADFRFFLSKVGTDLAFIHIEPDFWGYAGQVAIPQGHDAHNLPAAVATASSDCAGFEEDIAGLGKCMIAMTRHYAPNAKIGLHASAWGTNWDVLLNDVASFDVPGEGRKLGQFLVSCGAGQGDFVVADMSDRDAGYYQSIGRNSWWHEDATLPNFTQAFTWASAVAGTVGRPILWWQIPLGNACQNSTSDHWQDNRVDYLFQHLDQVTAAGGIGLAFGAGAGGQTTPSTDSGRLIGWTNSYDKSGGAPVCQ